MATEEGFCKIKGGESIPCRRTSLCKHPALANSLGRGTTIRGSGLTGLKYREKLWVVEKIKLQSSGETRSHRALELRPSLQERERKVKSLEFTLLEEVSKALEMVSLETRLGGRQEYGNIYRTTFPWL